MDDPVPVMLKGRTDIALLLLDNPTLTVTAQLLLLKVARGERSFRSCASNSSLTFNGFNRFSFLPSTATPRGTLHDLSHGMGFPIAAESFAS
jgi:hypothetical protein